MVSPRPVGLMLLLIIARVSRGAGIGFRFASYIDNYMVLQKEPSGAVIWGFGTAGATVTVTLCQGQETIMKKVTSVKGPSNTWMVVLDPMKPGGPFEVMAQQTLETTNLTLRVHDVLFGDVWLCSGQSNMQMTVLQIFNASKELSDTAAYQSVRIFSVSLTQAEEELADLDGVDLSWSKPTAGNLGHGNFTYMSAVCWLFGRYLYDTLQYPIGLVSSSWGGTPIEVWSSRRALKACGVPNTRDERVLQPEIKPMRNGCESKESSCPFRRFVPCDPVAGPATHSVLWNAMIHPLQNMTLKGVVWYQGENNANYNRDLYACMFPALIAGWRQTFHSGCQGQTERFFPFGFVQLSSYLLMNSSDYGFPEIRWHQTADFGSVPNPKMPNTFMAVAMDLCDRDSPFGSIHPRDKQTVAYRLHLGARAVAYGEKNLTFQGPLPKKIELLARNELLNLTYDQEIQVQRKDNKTFEISCCSDHQCKWLPAPVNTFSTQTLILDLSACLGTVDAVRYAWTTWPCEYKQCAVYHTSSVLPAPPFTARITHRGI
uniref:Sialate O-acetylesterase n=1 Tax=Rattus norvegicus TaxID=10116 RepID=SIAE_RAT|nr:RecName: Full=Sialate O-acetylesterase; AltName: Full=Sialic acid-specific 9-O-acetylesterase; AltName: Full=Yolk sac protein 2; Contains: RecName: Full=Sialate O-acetylesterase small subunit; Contains: RecName: Full=Sialate O-acetylesterase large subunit; Flags: Precursor [Rattus norvegicus]